MHAPCDLHLHTHYSDGGSSPAELFAGAASRGVSTLALTDHDNARAPREACRLHLYKTYGVTLVPGIELTCRWDALGAPPGKTDIDVLGYFIDLEHPALYAAERDQLNDLYARISLCCYDLTMRGYPVLLGDAFAHNPNYAGLRQLAAALVHRGHVATCAEASELVASSWQRVRPCALSIEGAIALIHEVGGVAVLAHPTLIPNRGVPNFGGWLSAAELRPLVEAGLDGLETNHPCVQGAASAHFRALAGKFDLLTTGGSDEHGGPDNLSSLGTVPVTEQQVSALQARAATRVGLVSSY